MSWPSWGCDALCAVVSVASVIVSNRASFKMGRRVGKLDMLRGINVACKKADDPVDFMRHLIDITKRL